VKRLLARTSNLNLSILSCLRYCIS
jgi:hypothetical protein